MSVPADAYSPGTTLTVGSHAVVISRYLSQGGFAHVYACTISPAFRSSSIACLKRVVVPSKQHLALLRQEVDAMRRLRGNTHIVSYIDSHASRLTADNTAAVQSYQVLVLMELCENNGLIDYMNTRLVHRLAEPEILDISRQIALGVANCHYLDPPLIHRDIKIENILIDAERIFKLCDFGSAIPFVPVPSTLSELLAIKNDAMQYTTPQYRAPEMINVCAEHLINDKLDIWALGCLIYKLCYYTTPFERPNQLLPDLELVILQAESALVFPADPPGTVFSLRLKNLIRCCLRRDPRRRPSIAQLLNEIVAMQGLKSLDPSELLPHSAKSTVPRPSQSQISFQNAAAPTQLEPPGPPLPRRRSTESSLKADPFASIAPKSSNTGHHTRSRPRSAVLGTSSRPHSQVIDLSSSALSNPEIVIDEDPGTLLFLRAREQERLLSSRHNTGSSLRSLKDTLRRISIGTNSTGNSLSDRQQGQGVTANGDAKIPRRSFSSRAMKHSVSHLDLISGRQSPRPRSLSRKASSISESHAKNSANPAEPAYSLPAPSNNKEATSVVEPTRPKTLLRPKKSKSVEKFPDPAPAVPTKLSIQSRVKMLMSLETGLSSHQASGYGKYTDDANISAINQPADPSSSSHDPTLKLLQGNSKWSQSDPSSSFRNLKSLPSTPNSHKTSASTPSLTIVKQRNKDPVATTEPSKHTKRLPPKPKKPLYLKVTSPHQRVVSTASDTLPDLDDLEKQFSRRYPSFV